MRDTAKSNRFFPKQEDETKDWEAGVVPLRELRTLFEAAKAADDVDTFSLDLDYAPLCGWLPIPRCRIFVKSGCLKESFNGHPGFYYLDTILGPDELDYECNRLIREIETLRLRGRRYFKKAEEQRVRQRNRQHEGRG